MAQIPENAESPAPDKCEWFACERPATKYRVHVIDGAKPICDDCDEKFENWPVPF